MLFATSQGVGLSPDSAHYIGAARNLLKGKGFMHSADGGLLPLTLYPPLFPVILAMPGIIGIDPLASARWVNAILFGANIVLVGNIVREMSRAPYWPALLASFLLLTSTVMYSNHVMALSEPTFIFLTLLGLVILASYLADNRLAFLILAAGFASLAFLTRYIGIVLVFVGGVTLYFLSRKCNRDKIFDVLLYGVIAAGPTTIWLARNWMLGSTLVGGREIETHIITLQSLEGGLTRLSSWFLPLKISGPFLGWLFFCGITIFVIFVFMFFHQDLKQDNQAGNWFQPTDLFKILTIFIPFYLVFVIFAISFVDYQVRLGDRILSPVYVVGLVILVSSTSYVVKLGPTVVRTFIFSIVAMTIVLHLSRAPKWIVMAHENGQGYASREWRSSRIIEYVRNLPSDTVIFSNGADAIYLVANRVTMALPLLPLSDSKLVEMQAMLHKHDGRVVYFRRIWRNYFPNLEELKKVLPLQIELDAEDGQVFRAK